MNTRHGKPVSFQSWSLLQLSDNTSPSSVSQKGHEERMAEVKKVCRLSV